MSVEVVWAMSLCLWLVLLLAVIVDQIGSVKP